MLYDDPLKPDGEDGAGTVFRDVITLTLLGFVAVVILLLPHLNPPRKQDQAEVTAPGNVIVEALWEADLDTDVDLWVKAPGDVPVGYSNKGGVIFNLLRDDLGRYGDATDSNHEISYSRGIPPGEYIVNVHLFRNQSRQLPVRVKVVASVKSDQQSSARQILATEVALNREGEEITAMRFRLDDKARLVPDSVNSLYQRLRSNRG